MLPFFSIILYRISRCFAPPFPDLWSDYAYHHAKSKFLNSEFKHRSDVKEGNRNIKRLLHCSSELVEDDECRRLPPRP